MHSDPLNPLNEPRASLAGSLSRTDLSCSGVGRGSNAALQANAEAQGADALSQKEVVPLTEMGDIQPALEMLLRVQAEYARGVPGVSRAMRDVAYRALMREIERYCGR